MFEDKGHKAEQRKCSLTSAGVQTRRRPLERKRHKHTILEFLHFLAARPKTWGLIA